jgi:GH25 family lysozyme M1 (1,4-beta-N-acetylmuramidase)
VRVPRVPAANWAGESWSVWQYTSDGSVAGIDGRVDRDVLRGLRALSVP